MYSIKITQTETNTLPVSTNRALSH